MTLVMLACEPPSTGGDMSRDPNLILDSIDLHFEDDPMAAKEVVLGVLATAGDDSTSSRLWCRCQSRLAVIHEQMGEVAAALGLYELMLAQCDFAPELIIRGLNNRVPLLIKTGNFELAAASLDRAFQMAKSLDKKEEQLAILQTRSAMYYGMGKCDSVVRIARQTMKLAKAQSDSSGVAKSLITMAACFNDLGQLSQSRSSLKQALNWTDQDQDAFNMIYIYLNLGVALEESGQSDSAAQYYALARQLSASIGERDMEVHAQKNLAYLAYDQGEFKEAFDEFESAQYLEDSIWNSETKQRIADLEVRYHTKEQESMIQLLEQENQIGALQRNFFIVLAFLFLAVATAAIVIYSNRIRTQKLLSEQRISQLEKEKEVMSLQSMLFAQEEERQRIARDLHDSIGALLSAAKLHLSNIEDEVKRLNELDFLKSTEEAIDRASKEVRRVAHDMMPGVLMRLGLTEGIEDFVERLRNHTKISISFTHDTFDSRLPNKHEVMIYRIIQELANNTIKHAEASEIKLMLKRTHNAIVIDYRDDGKGMDVGLFEDERSFGLNSLRSRVSFLKGDLSLSSDPGKGVHFEVEIPAPNDG